jgi:hypothetical protein
MRVALWSVALAALWYWATPALADEWNKKVTFSFDRAVEVPGHVLPPGDYVFQLADLSADRNVVQVFSEDKKGTDHLVTTAFAIPDYHLNTPEKAIVTFEERHKDSPEAIHAWTYPGDNYGWEFVYPKTERLVTANNVPAPAALSVVPTPKAVIGPQPVPAPVLSTAPKPASRPVTVAQNHPPASSQSHPRAAKPQQPAATPQRLPKTASNLPLAEGLGILMLALGAGILRFGRHTTQE